MISIDNGVLHITHNICIALSIGQVNTFNHNILENFPKPYT